MVSLKSKRELEKMRTAGRIVGEVLEKMREWVRPGVTTRELDRRAEEVIRAGGAVPSFKGYRGFPASICASVNEEVVHGIPGGRKLADGDLFTVDVGACWEGYHGDAARTFAVGEVPESTRRLMRATRESLRRGIAAVREGKRISDISAAIESYAEGEGFSLVRQYGGHGIGTALHEDPFVPNVTGAVEEDWKLEPGMVLAIEPMLNEGTCEVRVLKDGWTVVTSDGALSAHYEDTVALTENGLEILTAHDET